MKLWSATWRLCTATGPGPERPGRSRDCGAGHCLKLSHAEQLVHLRLCQHRLLEHVHGCGGTAGAEALFPGEEPGQEESLQQCSHLPAGHLYKLHGHDGGAGPAGRPGFRPDVSCTV